MTKKKGLLLMALGIYLAGYPLSRSMRLMVHSVSFYSGENGPVIAAHGVAPGDAGIPMLQPVATCTVVVVSLVYLPLTPFERIVWNIVEPPGSPYHYGSPPQVTPP